jgi:hypothetical protein
MSSFIAPALDLEQFGPCLPGSNPVAAHRRTPHPSHTACQSAAHCRDAPSDQRLRRTVFETMFAEPGLYLMDEPEAALSFTSCLRLVALMHELGQSGAQVICATHRTEPRRS